MSTSQELTPLEEIESINDISDMYERNPERVSDLLTYDYSDIVPRKFGHSKITVDKDSTGKSETMGEQSDYRDLFVDRFERMRDILSHRRFDNSRVKIQHLEDKAGQDVAVIGMIQEIRTTNNDNTLIVLDDTTGTFASIATDEELIQETESLMPDEVIAIEGQVANDGGIIFINDIYQPDVPATHDVGRANRPIKAVFLSDIHVGAENFALNKWHKFVDWIRQTPDIEYLVIAGDLVEGVGIFPDQEDELSFTQLDHQYKMCGELFQHFPDDLQMVTCTGNHDAVRLAEPQPALREKHQEYFPDNMQFVSNPGTVTLDDNVSVALYHGVSIHDFSAEIPDADEDDPEVPMKYMLEKRHLSPMFGNNARIAPEKTDYHLLEEIPDVIHSGHVHIYGTDTYRDINLLNTGGWVYQTSYQERMNIQPDVGDITIMNLKNGDIERKSF